MHATLLTNRSREPTMARARAHFADMNPDMPDVQRRELDPAQGPHVALSSWENEGGAPPDASLGSFDHRLPEVPELTNTELVQLRARVIALENLVIAMLAHASERTRQGARELAAYISPRPGFTQHPLTLHAAAQMIQIVERAARFHDVPPS